MSISCRDTQAIFEAIKADGYAVINPIVNEAEIDITLSNIRKAIPNMVDHATVGTSPNDILDNYQKLCVGGVFETQIYLPRLLRLGYSPFWAPEIYGIHKIGRVFAEFRNQVLSLPSQFGLHTIKADKRYTALRFQHYPTGGGFLVAHQDIVNEKNNNNHGFGKFLQFLMPSTKKIKDYERGGGFLIDKNCKKVDVDNLCLPGGVIVYSGDLTHGVAEIDPHKPFEPRSPSGRIVLMASLFKVFSEKDIEHYRLIQNE